MARDIGMTPREGDVLQAIRDLTVNGVAPTLEEIGYQINAHKSGVYRFLVSLRRQGNVAWEPRRRRSLVIVEDQVSPASLASLSDEALRMAAAHIAGILAQRIGSVEVAVIYTRIADRLPCSGQRVA